METHHLTIKFFDLLINLDTLYQVWLIMFIILVMSFWVTRSLDKHYISKKQFLFESLYDFWFNQMNTQVTNQKLVYRYISYIGSLFIFLLISYWSGLLPWKAIAHLPFWFSIHDMPYHYESPIMDMNIPLALAFLTLIIYLISGLYHGGFAYILAYLGISYHHGKLSITASSIISAFIEWLDVITRPVTLSLRIYANVLAGEALGLAIAGILPLVAPVFIMFFELGIGFLQSFIFATLSLVYIKIAISHTEEH